VSYYGEPGDYDRHRVAIGAVEHVETIESLRQQRDELYEALEEIAAMLPGDRINLSSNQDKPNALYGYQHIARAAIAKVRK
jgi:hypothetical protein